MKKNSCQLYWLTDPGGSLDWFVTARTGDHANSAAHSRNMLPAVPGLCCHPMQSNPATGSAGICTTSSTPKACGSVEEMVTDGSTGDSIGIRELLEFSAWGFLIGALRFFQHMTAAVSAKFFKPEQNRADSSLHSRQ